MKTPFIAVLYLLAQAATLSAQGTSDFILTKSGEQIAGEVFQPINQLRVVQFKPTGSDKFQTYSAGELRGYQFKQHFFTACDIPAEGGSVFLLTLVNGAANLYTLQTQNSFYIEKDGAYHLLERNDRMVDGKLMEDRRYMGILKALFADCSLPEHKFEHLKLSVGSLSSITQAYNSCRDPQVVYTKEKKSLNPIKLGVAGGVAFNKTETNGDYYPFISKNFGFNSGYAALVDLTISHSFASGFYFRPGIGLTKKHGGFAETYSLNTAAITYKLSFLQFPIKLGYVIDAKKLAPFFSVGSVYSLPIEKEFLYERVYISGGSPPIIEKSKLPKSKEHGFSGEAGIELKFLGRLRPFFVYQFEKTKAVFNEGIGRFTTHKAMLGIRFNHEIER